MFNNDLIYTPYISLMLWGVSCSFFLGVFWFDIVLSWFGCNELTVKAVLALS